MADITVSMVEVGEAMQNSYTERLIRTIKEGEVDLSDYQDYADACHQVGRFLEDVYMCKRIHSSLGYLTQSSSKTSGLLSRRLEKLLTDEHPFVSSFFVQLIKEV